MDRPYTEIQVLKKLDIPDFRHLTKYKVIAFATMIPGMEPEVAKKALEQFPNFVSTSLEIMKEYRGILQQLMNDDRDGAEICYDMYNRVMNSLECILENDNLTFKEKTYILEQMREVADEISKKDSEKSANRIKLIGIVSGVVAGVITVLGTAIGVNLTSKQNNIPGDDEEENH